MNEIREDGLYLINGKKVLYWQDDKWYKPVKNSGGRYGGYLTELQSQPKKLETIEFIKTV